MRNFVLLCCLMLLPTAFAQLPTNYNEGTSSSNRHENNTRSMRKSTKLSFGLQVNPTVSWFDVNHEDMQTDGAAITAGAGLIAEYNANRLFSFVTGLNFNMPSGYVFDAKSMNDITTTNNYLIKFYTIEVPVLLRLKTLPIDRFIYYAQGGIHGGLRLSSEEFHRASSSVYDDVQSTYDDYSVPLQLSYSVGFGASYITNRRHSVFGEVNYKRSIVNIASKDGFTLPTTVPELYNGAMVFTLGVMF